MSENALPLAFLTSIFGLLALLYYTGSSYELWLEKRRASKGASSTGRRRKGFWFQAFVYAETALMTLVLILSSHAHFGESHPIRGIIMIWTFLGTALFLLLFSPFFFRRLGFIAIGGWILAIVSIAWTALPQY